MLTRILKLSWVSLLILMAASAWAQTRPSPDCRMVAYLPPMATFGGPATAAPGNTELGLGLGAYGEILPSPCFHAGALDWFVRWRRGISERMDVGFDFLTNDQSDNSLGGTAKLAMRYRVTKGFRLEGGFGAADGGDGGNFNADFAAEIGTHNPRKVWNYYMSLRLAGARGCIGCKGINLADHAPGALVPLGVIGTTARISDAAQFVMEAGTGEIFSRQYSSPAGYVHLSFGVLFHVGKGGRQ